MSLMTPNLCVAPPNLLVKLQNQTTTKCPIPLKENNSKFLQNFPLNLKVSFNSNDPLNALSQQVCKIMSINPSAGPRINSFSTLICSTFGLENIQKETCPPQGKISAISLFQTPQFFAPPELHEFYFVSSENYH